jgi:hypothetical protein
VIRFYGIEVHHGELIEVCGTSKVSSRAYISIFLPEDHKVSFGVELCYVYEESREFLGKICVEASHHSQLHSFRGARGMAINKGRNVLSLHAISAIMYGEGRR